MKTYLILIKKNSPKDYRIEVIKEFTLDDNLKNILIKEVQKRILKEKLNSNEFRYFRTAEGKL